MEKGVQSLSLKIYDNDFVNLINLLSKEIKNQYKQSKTNFSEINTFIQKNIAQVHQQLIKITSDISKGQENNIFNLLEAKAVQLSKASEAIDFQISSAINSQNVFLENSKEIFRRMKALRNEKLDEIMHEKKKMDLAKTKSPFGKHNSRYPHSSGGEYVNPLALSQGSDMNELNNRNLALLVLELFKQISTADDVDQEHKKKVIDNLKKTIKDKCKEILTKYNFRQLDALEEKDEEELYHSEVEKLVEQNKKPKEKKKEPSNLSSSAEFKKERVDTELIENIGSSQEFSQQNGEILSLKKDLEQRDQTIKILQINLDLLIANKYRNAELTKQNKKLVKKNEDLIKELRTLKGAKKVPDTERIEQAERGSTKRNKSFNGRQKEEKPEQLKKQAIDLNDQNEQLKKQAIDLNNQNEQLKKQAIDLNNQNEQLNYALEEKNSEIQTLSEIIEKQKEDMHNLLLRMNKFNDPQKDLAKMHINYENLKKVNSNLQMQIRELSSRAVDKSKDSYKEKYEQKVKDFIELSKSLHRKENIIVSSEDLMKKAEAQIKEKDALIRKLEEEKNLLTQKIRIEAQKKEENAKQKEKEKEKVKQLTQELEKEKENFNKLAAKVTEKSDDLSSIREEKGNIQNELEKVKGELLEQSGLNKLLLNELDKVKNENKNIKSTFATQKKNIEQYQTNLKSLNDIIDDKQKTINMLNNSLKNSEDPGKNKIIIEQIENYKKLENAHSALQKDCEELEKQKEESKEKINKLNQLNDEKELLIKKLKEENEKLRADNNDFKTITIENQKKESEEKINKLNQLNDEKELLIQKLKEENEKLHEDNNEIKTISIENQKKESEEKINKLNQLNDEKELLIQKLKEENENLRADNDKIKTISIENQKKESEEKISKLNQLNDEKELLIQKLKEENEKLRDENNENKTTSKEKQKEESEEKINKLNELNDEKELLIQKLKEENEKLHDENDKIKTISMENQKKESEEEINKLNQLNDEKELLIKKLKEENERLRADNNDIKTTSKEKQKEESEEKINKLNQLNDEKELLIQKLKEENERLHADNNENKTISVENLRQVNEELKIKEDEIKSLKETNNKLVEEKTNLTPRKKFSSTTHKILLDKKYNGFSWVLLTKNEASSNIKDFIWVPKEEINLKAYNNFKTEKEEEEEKNSDFLAKINELKGKEEEISELKGKLVQLEKMVNPMKKSKSRQDLEGRDVLTMRTERGLAEEDEKDRTYEQKMVPMEKYQNVLQQLNKSNLENAKLQNDNKKLRKDIEEKLQIEDSCSFIKNGGGNDFLEEDDVKMINSLSKEPNEKLKKDFEMLKNKYKEEKDMNEVTMEQLIKIKTVIKQEEIKSNNICRLIEEILEGLSTGKEIKKPVSEICKILQFPEEKIKKYTKGK